MRYFLYVDNNGDGDDKLMEAAVVNGQIQPQGEALIIPVSGGDNIPNDLNELRVALARVIAWRDELMQRTDNGKVDTLQEAYDALNDMQVEDIDEETIDSWFPNAQNS